MKKKSLLILFGLVIILAAVGLVYWNSGNKQAGKTNPSSSLQTNGTAAPIQTTSPAASTNSPSATSSPKTTPLSNVTIITCSGSFSPATVTVKEGESVEFVNQESLSIEINSDPPPLNNNYLPLNIGIILPGKSSDPVVMTKAGVFGYYNNYNPAQTGQIIVPNP